MTPVTLHQCLVPGNRLPLTGDSGLGQRSSVQVIVDRCRINGVIASRVIGCWGPLTGVASLGSLVAEDDRSSLTRDLG